MVPKVTSASTTQYLCPPLAARIMSSAPPTVATTHRFQIAMAPGSINAFPRIPLALAAHRTRTASGTARPRANVSRSRWITARAHAQARTANHAGKHAAARTRRPERHSTAGKRTSDSAATQARRPSTASAARAGKSTGGGSAAFCLRFHGTISAYPAGRTVQWGRTEEE